MSESQWIVWYSREWFRLKVAICTYSNWAGSSYKFARDEKGRVVKFWARKAAQAHADSLNGAQP